MCASIVSVRHVRQSPFCICRVDGVVQSIVIAADPEQATVINGHATQ